MQKVMIGKIVNAAGLKGEVKVYSYAASKERFGRLKKIYIEDSRHEIEGIRYLKEAVVLKLAGIDGRNAAESVKGMGVYMDEADLPELSEGEYFIRDMIGMAVFDDKGNKVGELCDVLQSRAQDLYEVLTEDGGKILIPAVDEFIKNIDIEKKRIDVKLIEGLI